MEAYLAYKSPFFDTLPVFVEHSAATVYKVKLCLKKKVAFLAKTWPPHQLPMRYSIFLIQKKCCNAKSTAAFKANGVMFPTQPTFVATNFQTMYKGTVKFFNPKKGFGFIKEEISGKEVFVHSSDLLDKINEGDAVIFETKRGKKGVTAVDVKLS